MEQYIKIKAFAELTGVSVRTLQYYDEINLLKPAYMNEQGHRYYDAASFTKIFVILSLKNMGLTLQNIHQYVNRNSFDIVNFITEEEHRVKAEIMNLQLRLMSLSKFKEQMKERQEVPPALLSIFAQIASNSSASQLQIDHLIKSTNQAVNFNIKEWNSFIRELNYCYKNKLSVKNKKAIACIRYWKESIIDANQVSDDMVSFAEDYYQQNNSNSYGMTEETYKYLINLITEYDNYK
jgi:DNA-binding transcriptional MerR regulator